MSRFRVLGACGPSRKLAYFYKKRRTTDCRYLSKNGSQAGNRSWESQGNVHAPSVAVPFATNPAISNFFCLNENICSLFMV